MENNRLWCIRCRAKNYCQVHFVLHIKLIKAVLHFPYLLPLIYGFSLEALVLFRFGTVVGGGTGGRAS